MAVVLAGACAGTGQDADRTRAGAARPVTRAEAIAEMEANCTRIYGELAELPRDLTTPAGILDYADAMDEIVGRAIVLTDQSTIPRRDADVVRRVRAELESAQAVLLRRTAGMSLDDIGQFEEHLRRAASQLVDYGADACLPPPRVTDPETPPPGAGERVVLEPTAVVTVGPVGVDNNRIAAGAGAVWVGLKNGNALVRIDPADNRVVATIPIEQSPSGQIVVAGGYVWSSGERGLVRVDPRTNTVDRVIPRSVLGTGSADRVWVTSDAIWSCASGTGVVRRSQLRTGRVVAEVQLPTTCFELAADTEDVWIGGISFEADQSWLHHVDARTNELTASLAIPDGGRLPVAGDGAVWLDTVVGAMRITQDATGVLAIVGRPAGDVSFVSAFGSGAFWTTRESEQVVVRVDAGSLEVEEFAAGPGVNGVAVADGTLWVNNSDAGTVMRFDVDPWRTEGGR
jgi:hypothetical protein